MTNIFTLPIPQAGWKQSGIGGRLGGAYGIRKYCRTQAITSDRLQLGNEPTWYPYTPRKGRLLAAIFRALTARDTRRCLRIR